MLQPIGKSVTFQDTSPIRGEGGPSSVNYDYLVYAVGAETQTFGIPGAKENSCFLKELWDAEQVIGLQAPLFVAEILVASI